jgi:hypothetical protein
MIRPPGFRGAAFGTAADGDGRHDPEARRRICGELGLPSDWAFLHQVHGRRVWEAAAPGLQGDGDALFTTVPGLPLAVGTADCIPVALEGPGGVGLAHMGWRGAAAGVVGALRAEMEAAGVAPVRAAVGPGIGPCCYEVGAEVLEALAAFRCRTGRGRAGVDLPAAAAAGLGGLEVWQANACTSCGTGYHSYRRDGTRQRQVAVAWLP